MTDLERRPRELVLRPLDPARDVPSLLETWAAVFGERRSAGEWSRRFLDNPAGLRAFVACDGDRVVAQYAGVPSRVWIDGEEHRFVQSVDSLVHPDYRAGLKRPGLFVRLAREYFAHYGGPRRAGGDDATACDTIHYGWPLEAAWRVGKRFLSYERVREELVLVRELGATPSAPATDCAVEELRPGDLAPGADGDEIRWLWERALGAWGASAVRDAAYYRWRCAPQGDARYRMLGARDAAGTLRGLAVLRDGERLAPGARALVDWMVPADDEDAARALDAAARAAARADGGARLLAWLPDRSPDFAAFQDRGWRVRPTPYRLAARSFDRRFDALFLREHWWATLADSDLA